MVASSSRSGIDRLILEQGAENPFSGDGVPGVTASKNFRVANSTEISLRKSSRRRESGTVVSLFQTRPHVFGISQTQQLERDNARPGDMAGALEGFELRPLEAEALSLCRILKSLQPLDSIARFPTPPLPVEPVSPPSSQDRHSGEILLGVEVEGGGLSEDQAGLLLEKELRLAVKDMSDSVGSGRFTNSNLPAPKSAKSKGSTPSSSIGSASELHFPSVDLRSPPSPEPLEAPRPGSPRKWRSRNSSVSPVEEIQIINKSLETPVQGLIMERNPSFSDYFAGNMRGKLPSQDLKKSDANGLIPVDPEPSTTVRKMKAAYVDVDENEALRSMLPQGVTPLAANGKDYSIALEYHGPPIDHDVPKVEPMGRSGIRSSNEQLPTSKPASPSNNGSPSTSSRPRSSVSFVNPFPAWFSKDPSERGRKKREVFSWSVSSDGRDGPETNSAPFIPHSRTPTLVSADDPQVEKAIPEASRSVSEPDQVEISLSSTTSLVAGAQASARTSEGTSDDEFESAYKVDSPADSRPSVSRSFRCYDTESILPKSEPMGLYSHGTGPVDILGEDPFGQAGHTTRSMSLPGIQAIASIGSQAVGSHLTPTCEDTHVPCNNLQQRRKGECYLCRKGNRLTEKECCLVCNAKYCYSCVLIAMESMPEGRKCRTCIGKPVDEAKRPHIGKPSRLLSRLLRVQEVQQIMKAEKECAANQLRPQQLYVNGRQLTPEELTLLLRCPSPPQKLKPGRYWYDVQSGLWGKEGERPDKLISPDMRVGGPLQENASNGTTQVFMNGRELGKLELKMLKLAGVHCPPSTHLWVDSDGSYQEEGQNNSKGNIWNKTSIRLLYPFFSLPTPGGSTSKTKRDSPDIYMPGYALQNKLQKILVLGHDGSGRSTLFKQTKFLFKDGFTREERLDMKLSIQRHIYRYIGILLEGRERFEEEEEEGDIEDNNTADATGDYLEETAGTRRNVYALDGRLKQQAEWFSEMLAEGSLDIFISTSSSEYPLLVDELWRDPAIQATHKRKDELSSLPDAAEYFLDKVSDISSPEYIPGDEDILRAEGMAEGSGLAEIEFCLDDKMPSYQDHDGTSPGRYQLIKVGGKGMAEGCKWLDMFEDVQAVVFCVAISEYDQVLVDNNGVPYSKLRQKELFESVLKHPVLGEKPMVLLLNKYDLFEEKICKGIPLTTCEWFSDFRPVGASQMSAQMQAQQGYTYVVHKYKELFADHKLFTFKLNATEKDKVLEAFQYVREILKWKDNGWDLVPEEFSYSTDFSSYSQQQNFPPPRRDGISIDRNMGVEF